ncbi:MAG: hypothetical protein ACI9OJ_000093 [Myxococcota bacterium]|jgi:hypothetical protein
MNADYDGKRPMKATFFRLALLVQGIAITWSPLLWAAQDDEASLEKLSLAYQPNVQPLLKTYCHKCHSGDDAEAEIDLAAFATMADVRRAPEVWLKVREMLDSRQMPPKEKKQPTEAERAQLQTWVRDYLTIEAKARAGDPGPLVLRRLNNAEYNFTVRDLTGVASLDPTQEFPVDGAAGEGFTNTGAAQGMSTALVTKYLDAAKEVAAHAVLTPDGIRFSPYTSRRDRTNELLASIQAFYREFTEDGGGSAVNLQGIKFETNQGGRLPLARYLAATLAEREALASGAKTIEAVAQERNLSAKYLGTLWKSLSVDRAEDGSLIAGLRARWSATKSADPSKLVAEITQAQKGMWKFNSIGHIGRVGGPSRWMEAVGPRTSIATQQPFKWKLPEAPDGRDVVFYLATSDAGDGNDGDYVVWKNFRLEGGGRPPLPLRDVAGLQQRIDGQRPKMLAHTANYLAAAAAVDAKNDAANVAKAHKIDAEILKVWLDYLAIGRSSAVKVEGHLTKKTNSRKRITGWAAPTADSLPTVVANSSDKNENIPGLVKAHSVVAHPSPTLFVAAGWQSPIDGVVRVEASVIDAHHDCGNGVEWFLQHQTAGKTGTLWQGDFELRGSATMTPTTVAVRKGELLSLLIGPRKGEHTCDLTSITLVISETSGAKRVWDLAKDVSPNLQAGNPHEDSHGNQNTWHFYQGEMAKIHKGGSPIIAVPQGSLLAQWLAEKNASNRAALARRVQALATGPTRGDANSPDAFLQRQLKSLSVPVDVASLSEDLKPGERFGRHPLGHAVDSADLVVRAPDVVEFRIPAELAKGRQLVGTAEMEAKHGQNGTAQVQVLASRPDASSAATNVPILVREGGSARERIEGPISRFCNLFPPALCYARIVPVDEVVTLTLFHREDDYLKRLMLDEQRAAELDRLWEEFYFVSQEPLQLVVAFEQISEFATQDRPDLVKDLEPMRQPINDRGDVFRKRLVAAEPAHVDAVLEFADRAWRRPLSGSEKQGLRGLHRQLRDGEIPHEEAIRLTLARILTSPTFLYRREQPAPGDKAAPISDLELANRLSYFLWSSMPDAELRRVAVAGQLTDEKTLVAQARRMLGDERTRRLAIQFACQWLHVRDFDQNDDKNEKMYPQFATLRGEMYEETVRFFEDMFRNDGPVLGLVDADHTFLNETLAKHYGIGGVSGAQWRRVDGVREKRRGGVLGMATVLASQSGASRTSPILRGNWVFETLLGERLPRPPADVPDLPDTVPIGLTARQLIEQHSSKAACAKCHTKIDPYGFALEQYDAIGRLRPQAVDTKTKLPDGKQLEGIGGLRDYLSKDRHDDILEQFCRKLLGFSLGRAVQLSDEPLLADMQRKLKANGYRFGVAIEMIVTSRQFREIRGSQTTHKN